MLSITKKMVSGAICVASAALFSAAFSAPAMAQTETEKSAITDQYLKLAHANFYDALLAAERLQTAIERFLSEPNEETLALAKSEWISGRLIYGQTEAFRFGNVNVDDWEPQVNAWPLDEGFIDYVTGDNYFYDLGNPVGKANLIASETIQIGNQEIDVRDLSAELLASLNELGGTEANVATGWHAVEFLLWGQDLHGYEAGAGERPASDFVQGDGCTHGNCDRRAQYLRTVAELLVEDLQVMVDDWSATAGDNYYAEFSALSEDQQLRRILFGIGSLTLGELGGERIKVALYANSPEDEHDCFSDTTHNSLYANLKGILNILDGEYTSVHADSQQGPSLSSWLAENHPDTAQQLAAAKAESYRVFSEIRTSGDAGYTFDQMIAPGNTEGAAELNYAIQTLTELTTQIVAMASEMGVSSLSPETSGHF